jgi:hypothetical protein
MISAYILIAQLDGRQQIMPLRAGVLRIGSAPDNDLVLSGAGIAAHHATIRCNDQGDLLLTIGGRDTHGNVAATEIDLPRAFATAMLVRIGGYTLRYQPAVRPSFQQLQANVPVDDESMLLHALLDQWIVWDDLAQESAEQHEAITIEMQALRGVVQGE